MYFCDQMSVNPEENGRKVLLEKWNSNIGLVADDGDFCSVKAGNFI